MTRSSCLSQVSCTVLDVFTAIDAKTTPGLEDKLTLLHMAMKSSIFHHVMPIFLTALCSQNICNLATCKLLVTSSLELTVTLAKVRLKPLGRTVCLAFVCCKNLRFVSIIRLL